MTKKIEILNCQECNRFLRICQIQKKKINPNTEFRILTYFCNYCKLTYFIFKVMNSNHKNYELKPIKNIKRRL